MKTKAPKKKVLVALSGGVDSSVAAALLVASKKYEVAAAFMVNYDNGKSGSESCYINDYRDAVRVAAKLNISLLKLDFQKEYKEKVLDYMFKEYEAGRTPNPDVMCNVYIKFGCWLEKAKELGYDYLATGHYANTQCDPSASPLRKGRSIVDPSLRRRGLGGGLVRLLQSKDENKDQTYFLHQLNQEQLSRTLFPIGNYTKPEVRKLAKKFDLPTAEKEESMGICFVGEVPMKEFLETQIKPKIGNVVTSDGMVVGQHEGLAFYTIGQRHFVSSPSLLSKEGKREVAVGVGKGRQTPPSLPLERGGGDSRPVFVIDKKMETNELVVGFESDPLLFKKESEVENVHWVSGQVPKFPLKCEVRLRHRQSLQKAVVVNSPLAVPAEAGRRLEGGRGMLVVIFAKPQRAVTPGQFAVFYKKGECLGGGPIK